MLRDLNFTLRRGEAYGIIGESGSGKSTLAYAIMRYLGGAGRVESGAVLYQGEDLLRASERRIRALRGNRIAMVYQQPQAALNPSMQIGDQIAEVYRLHGAVSRRESRRRALEMLDQVRISDPVAVARLYPHQASGGMQQRVVIAMALALRPDLLLLDEPTTALDVTTQAAVLELLQDLRSRFGTSLIFIAHDLAVITRICERVAVFYAGEMVEEGALRDLFRTPRHPYSAGLIECLPDRGNTAARQPLSPIPGRMPSMAWLPSGCVYEPRCRYAKPECRRLHPELGAIAGDRRARCTFWREVRVVTPSPVRVADEQSARPASQTSAGLLVLDGVRKAFGSRRSPAGMLRGGRQAASVLDSVGFSMEAGKTVGLVGESGSGKTTLARCILGLTPADSGRITFGGSDLPLGIGRRDRSNLRELQMVFQNPDMSLNPRQTVRGILARPLRLLGGLGRKDAERAAADLLRAVNLDPRFLGRYPSQLSGGEKQRVAIARAFATRTKLVICDEPVSGLDVSVQATVLNLLQDLQRQRGTAYLFISHDLQVVRYLADHVLVLYRGHIVEGGSAMQVFSGPNHPYTELLLSAIPLPDPDRPDNRLALDSETRSESNRPGGCPFKGRCHRRIGSVCDLESPPLRAVGPGHTVLCHLQVAELPAPVHLES